MAWQLMDSSHAELLRNAIVRVIEEFGCTAERDVHIGEFGPTDRKRCMSARSACAESNTHGEAASREL